MLIFLWLTYVVLSIITSIKVVLNKRNPLAAALWLVIIWLAPYLGVFFYFMLGINRVKRKAVGMRKGLHRYNHPTLEKFIVTEGKLDVHEISSYYIPLAKSIHRLAEQSLIDGNEIEPLFTGNTAYNAMLEAIANSKKSIVLMTYIFHADGIGVKFISELRQAHARGVVIRVLLDGVMAHLTRPSVVHALRNAGIPFALFNSPLLARQFIFLNLRSHRKICVVDGRIGFTGGFNIHRDYWSSNPDEAVHQDTHFRVTGPIVAQLSTVFVNEWLYSSGETLRGEPWFLEEDEIPHEGRVLARGIAAGPNEQQERLRGSYLTALNVAQKSVKIMSPYFIPDEVLIAAIGDAINRQVEVDIFIPRNNSKILLAATMGTINEILGHGARLWLCPPPFNHSKLMIVDDQWLLMGSGNWDERSLRLNFEFNVECYNALLVNKINTLFRTHQNSATQFTYAEYLKRPFHHRLFDGCTRIFSPFL
ncbi:cardiolipin synthase [Acidithiobacillus thiooxidans]|jgi:cardiolipin synthase|uniref:cardiolipin synthase n=1 Tax=Acidithiobacillus thiooxidans TaxID=930 RepID=UPI00058C97D1|nr:cardiolipin synthase [Acidithiobacillus thiooxidans]MBU2810119.1 cardiolipin synthase [Acidithiobacillus thiooxidans]MBU2843335.1 cardiolipin synthase [Acidithiobacillus thiooxidans]